MGTPDTKEQIGSIPTTPKDAMTTSQRVNSHRGFASMTMERVREIASMGGKSVDPANRSFSKNRKLAREAGRKGGQSVPFEKRSYYRDRELAVKCGQKGGKALAPEKRSFSVNPALASAAGRKGGVSS